MFYLSHFYFQRAGVLTVLDKESLFARYVIVIFHNIRYLSSVQIINNSYWEQKLANMTRSAGKCVPLSCDWFWFYFWMDEKLAQVFLSLPVLLFHTEVNTALRN